MKIDRTGRSFRRKPESSFRRTLDTGPVSSRGTACRTPTPLA